MCRVHSAYDVQTKPTMTLSVLSWPRFASAQTLIRRVPLAWPVLCGLTLALMLSACSVPLPGSKRPPATVAAAPVKSIDAAAAERLSTTWNALGMKVEVEYLQVSDKPTDRIEWKSLNVVLSADPAQADAVMTAIGQFAARGAKPVIIHLYARSRKQDGVLSQALKKGAVESGGRNSVKLEHHIHPDFPVRVQLSIREGAQ